MTTAFILGAGFSKAIDPRMPLTTELSHRLLDKLGATTSGPTLVDLSDKFGGDFERWLTFLAEDHPWADVVQRDWQRSQLSLITGAVGRIIEESEDEVVGSGRPPEWLVQTVDRWEREGSTVITLNYDTLVEQAGHKWMAAPYPVTPRERSPLALPSLEKLKLLKLHGSLNWWIPDDPSEAGVGGVNPYNRGRWSREGFPTTVGPALYSEIPSPRLGIRQLIVPPTATKSGLLSDTTLRWTWQLAHELISSSDTLFVLGYSMPIGDQSLRFLLSEVPHGARVVCANPDSSAVERIREAIPQASVEPVRGERALDVETWARRWCQERCELS